MSAPMATLLWLQGAIAAPQTWIPPVESRSEVVVTLPGFSIEQLVKKVASECAALQRGPAVQSASEVVCTDTPDAASRLAYMMAEPRSTSPLEGWIRFAFAPRPEGIRVSALRFAEYQSVGGRKVRIVSEETDVLQSILSSTRP